MPPAKPEEDRSELSTAPDLQIGGQVGGHPSPVGIHSSPLPAVTCPVWVGTTKLSTLTWRADSRYFQDDFISSKGAKCQLRGEGFLLDLTDFSRSTFLFIRSLNEYPLVN
jgi:hypothetical protein